MNGIEGYRMVRWTTSAPFRETLVVHDRLVPSSDDANQLARALVALYDPQRERHQWVAVDPRQKQAPAPDLGGRLVSIQIGSPEQTDGFWWTSPNLRSDAQRARIIVWNWQPVDLEQPS